MKRSVRHPSWHKSSCHIRSRGQSPLLPGLPDDLAIVCLVRVPRIEHRKLRIVCKRWNQLLAEDLFYSLRKSLGIAEEWIYVIKRDRNRKISFHAFDPVYQLWQPLPPIPMEYSKAPFECAVLNGCHLYLLGESMRRVIFYSARTNKWHQAPSMLQKRLLSASCVINNCLYVAGGASTEDGIRFLRSAEVYDPNKNRWSFIAEMEITVVSLMGVVYNGKWFLKGIGLDGEVLDQVYDPETDNWFEVDNGMVAGWTSKPSISMNGNLYNVDCKDGCKLRIYDMATDSWSKHIDSKLHLGNSRDLRAVALVQLNGKLLCIIRNNMSISVLDVSTKSDEERGGGGGGGEVVAYHLWETVEGKKGQFNTFIKTIWSRLFSWRNHGKSEILHCQILEA
ncbi:F-box domain [Macleaya cordata]|uniref:F-box domain n=1 Tax=Macleaya cordata TaxID=56857 RepID=A0A200PQF0_MACCD|nr:F-box domain [Macleaya cordata]